MLDICSGESSAAHFVERAEEEEKANDTSHVQDKENQNEVFFRRFLGIYSQINFIVVIIFLWGLNHFWDVLVRSFKSRFRMMNDGNIRRWKEGKRHNAHLKVCLFKSLSKLNYQLHFQSDWKIELPIKKPHRKFSVLSYIWLCASLHLELLYRLPYFFNKEVYAYNFVSKFASL